MGLSFVYDFLLNNILPLSPHLSLSLLLCVSVSRTRRFVSNLIRWMSAHIFLIESHSKVSAPMGDK